MRGEEVKTERESKNPPLERTIETGRLGLPSPRDLSGSCSGTASTLIEGAEWRGLLLSALLNRKGFPPAFLFTIISQATFSRPSSKFVDFVDQEIEIVRCDFSNEVKAWTENGDACVCSKLMQHYSASVGLHLKILGWSHEIENEFAHRFSRTSPMVAELEVETFLNYLFHLLLYSCIRVLLFLLSLFLSLLLSLHDSNSAH